MTIFYLRLNTRQTFKEFDSAAQAGAYIAACKRNSPAGQFVCESVDLNADCTGLKRDPRCTGRWCTCQV